MLSHQGFLVSQRDRPRCHSRRTSLCSHAHSLCMTYSESVHVLHTRIAIPPKTHISPINDIVGVTAYPMNAMTRTSQREKGPCIGISSAPILPYLGTPFNRRSPDQSPTMSLCCPFCHSMCDR